MGKWIWYFITETSIVFIKTIHIQIFFSLDLFLFFTEQGVTTLFVEVVYGRRKHNLFSIIEKSVIPMRQNNIRHNNKFPCEQSWTNMLQHSNGLFISNNNITKHIHISLSSFSLCKLNQSIQTKTYFTNNRPIKNLWMPATPKTLPECCQPYLRPGALATILTTGTQQYLRTLLFSCDFL